MLKLSIVTPSGTLYEGEVDYLVIDEENLSTVSSTIIDATKIPFEIIRQGDIKL